MMKIVNEIKIYKKNKQEIRCPFHVCDKDKIGKRLKYNNDIK